MPFLFLNSLRLHLPAIAGNLPARCRSCFSLMSLALFLFLRGHHALSREHTRRTAEVNSSVQRAGRNAHRSWYQTVFSSSASILTLDLEREGFFFSLSPLLVRFGAPSPLLYDSERLFFEPPDELFFGISPQVPSTGSSSPQPSSQRPATSQERHLRKLRSLNVAPCSFNQPASIGTAAAAAAASGE